MSPGLLLRECKELWVPSLLLAAAHSLALRRLDSPAPNPPPTLFREEGGGFLRIWRQVKETWNLDGVWLRRPLLPVSISFPLPSLSLSLFALTLPPQGTELIARLGLSKGPVVGLVMEEQVRWQLRNPCGDGEACLEYLRSRLPEIEPAGIDAERSAPAASARRKGSKREGSEPQSQKQKLKEDSSR
jgi:hypothetical protein